MQNKAYKEQAVDETPLLPEVCEYCGGSIKPRYKEGVPRYYKHNGTCQECGAEYGLMQLIGGEFKMTYGINRVSWIYHGDGRKTMHTKRAKLAQQQEDARHRKAAPVQKALV